MFTLATALVILATGAAALPAASSSRCDADLCLRAVRASAFPTRSGTADCSSFFRATVTPAIETVTVTNVAYATTTATDDVIETKTVLETATETIYHTATEMVPFTARTEVTQYSNSGLARRQQTQVPSAIPSYASACSGTARYESACSCVGVTRTTVTLPAELTTVVADKTVTDATATITITVATNYVIFVDATSTVQTTDATVTQSTPVATATDVNYIVLSDRFAIEVVSGAWAGQHLNRYQNRTGVLGITASTAETPDIYRFDGTSIVNSGETLSTIADWLAGSIRTSPVIYPSMGGSAYWTSVVAELVGDQLKFYVDDSKTSQAKVFICPDETQFASLDVIVLTQPSIGGIAGFGGTCFLTSLKAVPVPF